MLKPVSHNKKVKKNSLARFFDGFNKRYDHLARRYKINLRLFLNRRFPVSYTHLFVFLISPVSVPVQQDLSVLPVSYTHLDVYKRQLPTELPSHSCYRCFSIAGAKIRV